MNELKQLFDRWLSDRTIEDLRTNKSEVLVRKFGANYQIMITDSTLKELVEIVDRIKEHGVNSTNQMRIYNMTNGVVLEKSEVDDGYAE